MAQQLSGPQAGDVLITTEATSHFLSVVPHPHRLSFNGLEHARDIPFQWARANAASVWQTRDGHTFELLHEEPARVLNKSTA
jgi:hypothetical protein